MADPDKDPVEKHPAGKSFYRIEKTLISPSLPGAIQRGASSSRILGPTIEGVAVNVQSDLELAHWAKRLGVSVDELIAAVKAVGPSVDAVQSMLVRRK